MELDRQKKLESDLPDGKLSENELKELHGIGPNAFEKLRHALEMKGLAFSMYKDFNNSSMIGIFNDDNHNFNSSYLGEIIK